MAEHKIIFLPQKKSGCFEEGTAIRDAAIELGLLIDSACAGIGSCAQCKVIVKEGAAPVTAIEKELLTRPELAKGVRLACRAAIHADCLCIIPEKSISGPGLDEILTTGKSAGAGFHPEIRKVHLQIPPPAADERPADIEPVVQALRARGQPITDCSPDALAELPAALHERNSHVTAVLDGSRLLAVEPGDTAAILHGVAVDIGTTTVAAKLIDLATGEVVAVTSGVNNQSVYGADVISRIHYVMRHPGGLKRLHRTLINQLNAMITHMAKKAGTTPRTIYEVMFVGNTVMQHIAANTSPASLGATPYTPVLQGPLNLDAEALGLRIHPQGVVHSLPILGGFVGSDITAVLAVLDLDRRADYQLVIDMGTNGEIVLGNRDGMLCCSSPAGPAWEGGCINWGMRAARGAIERAEIVGDRLQTRTIGDASPIGICGSGLIDLTAEFLRAGIIQPSGRILRPEEVPADVPADLRKRVRRARTGTCEIIAGRVPGGRRITLTQDDVREIQLAKAAIAAGARLLLQHAGISPERISTVSIAGAFGNHIRPQDVRDLGLLPALPNARIQFIGNAALTGAEAVLCSHEMRVKAERIAEHIDYLDISGRPDFQEAFVEAMHFSPLHRQENPSQV